MSHKFTDYNLSVNAIKAIEKNGFSEPTYIQNIVIPLILEEKMDLLVQSQTGTGKTAAFAIPLIEKLEANKKNQILIMAPTRELVIQLSEMIHKLCGRKRIKIALLYGGQSFDSQLKRLKAGAEIIIGTPGRLTDHITHKSYKTDKIKYLILDEVDEMLKNGFANDIEQILKHANRQRKTYFFSATVPEKITKLAKIYTKKLEIITASKKKITSQLTDQFYFELLSHDKYKALKIFLDYEKNFYGIIFCKTRLKAEHLGKRLKKMGFLAGGIHGGLAQEERELIIGKFRQKKIKILTATDVAARGLDVPNLTHIINYSLPQTPDIYVHRIGRTGRAGKTGIAITFVTPEDSRDFFFIKKTLKQTIHRQEIEQFEGIQTKEIVSEIVDTTSPLRLFISLGKKNKMTKNKLVEYLSSKTEIPNENFTEILLSDTFSFVTVSYEDGQNVLKAFKGKKNGKRKMVEIAKPKTEKDKKVKDA